jgi:hypothetical protein
MTFYHDEFAFLLLRDLSINGIFSPHSEHLSATLVILYRVLYGTVDGVVLAKPQGHVHFTSSWPDRNTTWCGAKRRPPGRSGRWPCADAGIERRRHPVGIQSGLIGAVAAGMAA